MEFFEKAHVPKRKPMSKVDKRKEATKKQLKQMLYGYKTSDSKIMKKIEDINPNLDDSSSVSGFSDLNLTNSSFEEIVDDANAELSADITDSKKNLPIKVAEAFETSKHVINKNTEGIAKPSLQVKSNSSSLFDTKSSASSILDSISDNDTSDEFDPNGHLAAIISNKIKNNQQTSSIRSNISSIGSSSTKSSSTKSILDNISEEDLSEEFDLDDLAESNRLRIEQKQLDQIEISSLAGTKSSSNTSLSDVISEDEASDDFDADGHLASIINNNIRFKQLSTGKTNNMSSSRQKETLEVSDTLDFDKKLSFVPLTHDPQPLSPPFVSITAEDMPSETLDGVLGDYKYPTSRVLPADYHCEVVHSNMDFIPEDTMSVDINMEDEVGSLIPEVDEDLTVEDIDVSLNVEPSLQIDESISNELDIDETKNISMMELNDDMSSNINFYYTNNGCIIIMKHYSELYVHGKVRLKALGGKVEVFGYTVDNKYCELYAPYCSFAHCIKTLLNDNVYYGLFSKLTAAGLSVADAENIVTSIETHDAIIYLEKYNSKKIDFIEKNFTLTNLFDSASKNKAYFKKASDILGCSLYLHRPQCFFVEHPSWEHAMFCAEYDHSRGIVCGGKGIGKSTFIRYQVNKLLEKGPVLVIDLDPGQCEFTVAGNISATVVRTPLLGPNYTHLRKPEITLNIGMISTMDNVKRYVEAVRTLISQSFNKKEFVNMPWLVNTMGMTNGLGLKFMVLIILLTKPTYMLQYNSKVAKKCYETDFDVQNVMWLYEKYKNDWIFRNTSHPYQLDYTFITAQDPGRTGRSNFSLAPKEARYLSFLAYFSEILDNVDGDNILAATPYQVPLKQLHVFTNVKVKENFIAKVINGKVVALCQHSPRDNAAVLTLNDKSLSCHGHGLVRGIDWEQGIVYIITPLSSEDLGFVNALVYADWVPEIASIEGIPTGTIIPYCTKAQEKHKHLMFSPRRRFNPLQLLKMTRNT